MPKKLDPVIGDILKKHNFDEKAVWDCHGTWVIYHNVLEKIAAKEEVIFSQPHICSSDVDNVAVCVTGEHKSRTEWSIGEASPKNCKNAYPWAMAEKRAKDRVILKLIGLAGLVYSEEEAYDIKAEGKGVWQATGETEKYAKKPKGSVKLKQAIDLYIQQILRSTSIPEFVDVKKEHEQSRRDIADKWPEYMTTCEGEQTKTFVDQIAEHHKRLLNQENMDKQSARDMEPPP